MNRRALLLVGRLARASGRGDEDARVVLNDVLLEHFPAAYPSYQRAIAEAEGARRYQRVVLLNVPSFLEAHRDVGERLHDRLEPFNWGRFGRSVFIVARTYEIDAIRETLLSHMRERGLTTLSEYEETILFPLTGREMELLTSPVIYVGRSPRITPTGPAARPLRRR